VLQGQHIPPNVSIVRIHGPFLFGTTEKLATATANLDTLGSTVIIRLRNMPAIDVTGLHALETFSDRLIRSGRTVLLCGARDQPARLLRASMFLRHLGPEDLVSDITTALARARALNGDVPVQTNLIEVVNDRAG
jgi:SulP family sulfate permease